jgi:hypothetical protein
VQILIAVMALELILYTIARNISVTEVLCFVQVLHARLCNIFVLSHLIPVRRFVLVDRKFRELIACSRISKPTTHCGVAQLHMLNAHLAYVET